MNFKILPFCATLLLSMSVNANVTGNFIVQTDFIKTTCTVSVSSSNSPEQVLIGENATTAVIDLGVFTVNDFANNNTTALQPVTLDFTGCPDVATSFSITGTQVDGNDDIFAMTAGVNKDSVGLVMKPKSGSDFLQNTATPTLNSLTLIDGSAVAILDVGYKHFDTNAAIKQQSNMPILVTLNMIYGS